MLREYLPILFLIVVAILFCAGILLVSQWLGQRGKHNPTKDSPYECGVVSPPAPLPRFHVKFYRVAMLFILFDIEVVFLFPWAVVYRRMLGDGVGILAGMFTFLAILFIGYLYALRKGALDWEK